MSVVTYGMGEADPHLSGFREMLMQDERPSWLAETSVSQIFGIGTVYSMSCFICCCGDTPW